MPLRKRPFVASADQVRITRDRDFTLGEFMTLVGTFGGWGMRIEFVPDDELHQRPKLRVREPDAKKGSRTFARKRA